MKQAPKLIFIAVKMSWHVPSEETIDFALQIFKELVEPTLGTLEDLLKPELARDAVWRNDFCRYVLQSLKLKRISL
jgi:proteasome activator subunit 4